jgi:hypothetical protein
VDGEVKAKVPLMAPTVEVKPKRNQSQELPRASVSTVTLDPSVRLYPPPAQTRPGVVARAGETKPRGSSLSSLNLYTTNDTFSGESTPRTSRFQVPVPVVVITVLVGLAIALAISWSDIQKARARKAAAAQMLTAHIVASQSPVAVPKRIEDAAALSMPPPALPEAAPASAAMAIKPAASVSPAATQVSAQRPKAPPARPATKETELVFSRDNDVPTVTKAELERMRAREKALAADLDRESAAVKKAKAVRP